MKRLFIILIAAIVCSGFASPILTQASSENVKKVIELNFVFLHGYNGNSGALQLLDDSLEDQMAAYIANYESEHPDITIQTDTLLRCYPNNVDIETWAQNVADAINEHFSGKKNLVLVGHSMGGKTALYAVSHNIGNIADKVAMVVTINSPIKGLGSYYFVGGDTALDFYGAQYVLSEKGVLESLVDYDSSQDGQWVGANKHWLAFISSESSPLSSQFDASGIDPLPRDMDDSIVPISCQYADGADVVYYGEYAHSDFTKLDAVADYLADQILRYIFGGNMEFSVYSRGGSFEHKAGLFPGTDYWQDEVGGVLAGSGTVMHRNDTYLQWMTWEDVVGQSSSGSLRSSYETSQKTSFPFLTGLKQSGWASAEDTEDSRLYLITRAAPGSTVQVDWSVYQQGLLPSGIVRSHYEVELETGTQFVNIEQVSWETSDLQDVRLLISSEAQSPFRWFKALWRVYYNESRQMQIIDELAADTASP